MKNFILDFETFGQDVLSVPIINCAFMRFDTDRFVSDDPYTYDELLDTAQVLKLSVEKQVRDGYVIEPSSLDFWSKVDPAAKKQLVPRADDLTYDQFCDSMLSYLGKDKVDYWWSRSNTFDPILLWRIFNDAGKIEKLQWKLKFWRVRDIRTYIDAKTDFQLDMNGFIPIGKAEWDAKFKLHDSKHDITADVLRLQRVARADNGLE